MTPVGDAWNDLFAEVLQDALERFALLRCGPGERTAKIARRYRREDPLCFDVSEVIREPVDDLVTVTAERVGVRGATSLP